MVSGRSLWLPWAVVAFWLLFAVGAQAAVELRRPPAGWASTPSEQAVERADDWANVLGGRVDEVFSTRGDDEFSETLAVIGLPGAMKPEAVRDPASTLTRTFEELFESEPADTRAAQRGAPVLVGAWSEDGVLFEVALVSAGPRRAAVILAVREEERSLYGRVFEDVLDNLAGIAAPLPPFDVVTWRWGTVIGWAAFLVLTWLGFAATERGRDGAGAIGRAVAVICVLAAIAVSAAAYVSLADQVPSLRLAEVQRGRMAIEVAVGGLLAALVAWFLGVLRDSTVRRVESAPTGGTFSGSARTMSSNLVPPTRPAMLTDPGHGMSPEALDKADMEAMRQPKRTLVGAPSLAAAAAKGDDEFDRVWAEAQAAAEAAVDEEAAKAEAAASEAEPEPDEPSERVPVPKDESTLVGPAPAPKRTPKTKTEVLQFPPPMDPEKPRGG